MTEKKKDLTRIEDLSDYLHEDNAETDAALSINEDPTNTNIEIGELAEDSGLYDISESFLEEEDSTEAETPPDFPESSDEEDNSFQTEDYEPLEDDIFSESTESTISNDSEEEEEELIDIFAEDGDEDEDNFQEDYQPDFSDDSSEITEFESATESSAIKMPQVTETELFTREPQNETLSEILIKEENESYREEIEEEVAESYGINKTYPEKEKFTDLNEFAKSITYGEVAAGGNPPFSIILKNIVFKEDAEDILIILREHKLVDDNNEETMNEAMQNGSILISQISEYSAIYLAHKFRRFNVDILLGLSEELHPAKSYERNDVGLTSKRNIRQNERDSYEYREEDVKLDNILLATTPTLQNHIINKYISIISEHKIVEESELLKDTDTRLEKDKTPQKFDFFDKNEDRILENISFGLDEVYKEMANVLKEKCLKLGGNAVVGINFQLTPLFSHSENKTQINYKITATGNVVWVISHGDSIEHS